MSCVIHTHLCILLECVLSSDEFLNLMLSFTVHYIVVTLN